MIDKAAAMQLRLQGWKYEDIADSLHCSVAWCKKNLKGVRQGISVQDASRDDLCNRILVLVEQLRAV
jgi:DNA-directed RNA polymerase specialized sigma24 family protein